MFHSTYGLPIELWDYIFEYFFNRFEQKKNFWFFESSRGISPLKADRDLSKLNFLFDLKSQINLVTLRKFNSYLQYYKIDLSFSIKLHERKLNVCEEYKTEPNSENKKIVARAIKYIECHNKKMPVQNFESNDFYSFRYWKKCN